MRRALAAGIPAARIVFSGVGKGVEEIRFALEQGVAQINAESAEEIAMLSAIASGMGREVRVALRINPDVDARTHPKITTGRAENKFGIPYADAPALYARAAAMPGIRMVGIALHIGSQILSDRALSRSLCAGGGAGARRCGRRGRWWRAWIAAAGSASPIATSRRPRPPRSPAPSARHWAGSGSA